MAIHSIQRVHHVQLAFPAGSEGQIRNFYHQLLGLPELRQPPSRTLRFAAGAQQIELVPTDSNAPASVAAHLAFEVDNLPELRSRLLQAQLQLVENRALPGYLRFYVKDPAGNQLEFLEPDDELEYPV